jgi:hypothetical protein
LPFEPQNKTKGPDYESVGELVAATAYTKERAKLVKALKALLPNTKEAIIKSEEAVLRYE